MHTITEREARNACKWLRFALHARKINISILPRLTVLSVAESYAFGRVGLDQAVETLRASTAWFAKQKVDTFA